LAIEIGCLTIRWVIWLCVKNNEEKRINYLAAGWAIETREYVKCLIQAGIANAASFGMSMLGAIVGAFIPLPGATIGFSIFFGFIGYVIARSGSGALINMLEQMLDKKNE
jgi:hypothetical protein